MGAVLHTLNVRLFADQLTYIVNHAEDRVILVEDSLRRDRRSNRRRAAELKELRGGRPGPIRRRIPPAGTSNDGRSRA
jgi:hypothetical protein